MFKLWYGNTWFKKINTIFYRKYFIFYIVRVSHSIRLIGLHKNKNIFYSNPCTLEKYYLWPSTFQFRSRIFFTKGLICQIKQKFRLKLEDVPILTMPQFVHGLTVATFLMHFRRIFLQIILVVTSRQNKLSFAQLWQRNYVEG